MFCSKDCKDTADKGFLKAEFAIKFADFNHRILNEALDTVDGSFEKLNLLLNDPELSNKTIFDFDFTDVNNPRHNYFKLLAFNGLFKGPFVRDMHYIESHPCLELLNHEEKEIAKKFLLQTFKILTMNQFGLEWHDRPQRPDMGSAILLFGGLLNTCCFSNVDWINVDEKFVFFTRRTVQKDEQLFLSQG
jgi:hypothetical protein